MNIPEEYTRNLENGIILKSMLSDVLYSVNKRAKNARDSERAADCEDDMYDSMDEKNKWYAYKDKMLSLLKPTCIHAVKYHNTKRYYDYQKQYYNLQSYPGVSHGEYFDQDFQRNVKYIDISKDTKKYFLFYDLGDRSFHSPVAEWGLEKYSELQVICIDELTTYGEDEKSILPAEFCHDFLKLINSGKYQLAF